MKWGQSNCSNEFIKCYVAFRTLGCSRHKSSGKFSSQQMRRVWKEVGAKKKKEQAKNKEGSSRAIKRRIRRCCNIICPSSSLCSPPTVLGNTLGIAGATPAGAPARTMKCFSPSAERILEEKKKRKEEKTRVKKSPVDQKKCGSSREAVKKTKKTKKTVTSPPGTLLLMLLFSLWFFMSLTSGINRRTSEVHI